MTRSDSVAEGTAELKPAQLSSFGTWVAWGFSEETGMHAGVPAAESQSRCESGEEAT